MNIEKLLVEAKNKYLIGNKVICLTDKKQETLIGIPFISGNKILCSTKENPNSNCVRIYMNGKWATIVSTPIKCYELW